MFPNDEINAFHCDGFTQSGRLRRRQWYNVDNYDDNDYISQTYDNDHNPNHENEYLYVRCVMCILWQQIDRNYWDDHVNFDHCPI